MCDLTSDVITALFEAAIWLKSTHLIKSCLKTRKKIIYGNKIHFYTKFHQKDGLHIEFTAC